MPNQYLAEYLLELGSSHPEDAPVLNAVAARIKRGDLASLKELNGLLSEEDSNLFCEALRDSHGINLKLKPASRRKFGTRRMMALHALQSINL